MNAPGINHRTFAFACQHIVADIIPVINADNATDPGINPEINIATIAETIPDIVENIAVFTPSKPCLPDAKYAVHPAKPIHVTSPND